MNNLERAEKEYFQLVEKWRTAVKKANHEYEELKYLAELPTDLRTKLIENQPLTEVEVQRIISTLDPEKLRAWTDREVNEISKELAQALAELKRVRGD